MQGFKNLIPRSLLNDDSVQPLVKKSDQQRKTIQIVLQHILSIGKNIQCSYSSFEKQVYQLQSELSQSQSHLPSYYIQLMKLFKNLNVQQKMLSQKTLISYKQLNNICNTLFLNYSNIILNFQQHIRNYQAAESIVFEMSKRYSRNFKNMITYIQSYKGSFTDARLIYNNEEKIKRYNMCETTYKLLIEDLKQMADKCNKLNQKKLAINQNFLAIDNQMKKTIKVVGSKIIGEIKNIVKNYSDFQKTALTLLAQKKFSLQKLNICSFFESIENTKNQQYFQKQVKPSDCEKFPAIFVYSSSLRNEYIPFCKSAFLNYLKDANVIVQRRKQMNKKTLQFLKIYVKSLQRSNYFNLKEIITSFQKIKKKLSELFGGRFASFIKSIHSIFQLSIGIHEKMLKTIAQKLKSIQSSISEQNKHMELFIKQLKINIDKFIGKKQLKREDSFSKDKQISSNPNKSTISIQNIEEISTDHIQLKKQIKQRSQFLIHLITGFITKLETNHKQTKININSIINDFFTSTNQFYSLCCQYEIIYFGKDQFISNFQKYQIDIDKTLEKQTHFIITQLNFNPKNIDQGQITFDGELNKFQQFKKLKKPNDFQQISKKSIDQKNLQKKTSNLSDMSEGDDTKSTTIPSINNISPMRQSSLVSSHITKEGTGDKYLDILTKKIIFGQNQVFIKSFSCAFYDKIILQGRIYLTNCRLCFYSKFNSNTVFFGETFIQIPKKDIKKVQKRYNALIFDNSIAITTVNGQMFFTSFFSRDQAYNLLTSSLDINLQEQFFQAQEINEDQLDKSIDTIEQEDDLKPEAQKSRQEETLKLIEQFPYQVLYETQIQVPKITAIKFFRLFDSGQQISHNRRTYSSFLNLAKDSMGHKEIQIHHFKPNILQFLNTNNIKQVTPVKIQRKLTSMVPISAAGVPFMPKAARSDQIQSLYFISKHKYIIQSIIQNSGAPYTDCFNVRLRRTVQSADDKHGKVSIKVQMYVNFIKSTIMKTMIQSKAIEQTKAFYVRMLDQVRKYFKNLQKTRRPGSNSNTNVKGTNLNQEQFQQLRKQIDSLTQQKQKLQQKVNQLDQKYKSFQKYLLIAVMVIVFLFLLLIS